MLKKLGRYTYGLMTRFSQQTMQKRVLTLEEVSPKLVLIAFVALVGNVNFSTSYAHAAAEEVRAEDRRELFRMGFEIEFP